MKRGAENPNWRGGRIRGGHDGRYWLIHAPEHPNASSQGYMLEHRLVMERELGRYLTDDEVVHHRNHDPRDNRPENLEVTTQAEHVREHMAGNYFGRPTRINVHDCEHCGEPFVARGKRRDKQRFCSRDCYWNYRRETGGALKKGVSA